MSSRRLACSGLVVLAAALAFDARRLGAGEVRAPAPGALVRMAVRDVKLDPAVAAPVVVLESTRRDRLLLIVVGPAEAAAILRGLGRLPAPRRPMTHDLLKRVIRELGGKLNRVVVTRLAGNTFYAELVIEFGRAEAHIDARPSDSVALAVRLGAPIFVARGVLDAAGVPPGRLRGPPPRRPQPRRGDDDII